MPHVGKAGEQRGPQPPLGASNEGAAGLEGTVPPPEPRRRLGSARLEADGERLSAWRAGKAMACEAQRAAVKHLLRDVLLTMCTINHHHSSPVALARPRPEPGRGGKRDHSSGRRGCRQMAWTSGGVQEVKGQVLGKRAGRPPLFYLERPVR